MNLAFAFGGYPVPTWERQEGAHTPSGSKTPIIICGWLLKMTREHRKFRSTWNRRWFTVEDGAFHWYKTSSSDACGRLSLTDIQSVRRYVGTEHGSFTFVVHTTDREILLRTDSANDESRWIRGLTLQADLVQGGTFQGPPSAKNRRRSVIKLMGESCCVDSGKDGREGDKNKWDQNRGGNDREGEWKGDGSQFREINKKIRALMNDQDNNGVGGASGNGSNGPSKQIQLYSDQMPLQKFKITPRDPRGISIVGGRGLGNFPADNGASINGAGGAPGSRRLSTSKVVPIAETETPCSRPSEMDSGGVGSSQNAYEVQDISTASTDAGRGHRECRSFSSSTDSGRWPVVKVVSSDGRRKPPMPSGPPPANARGNRAACSGDGCGDGGRKSKQHRYSAGDDGSSENGAGGRQCSFPMRTGKKTVGAGGGRDRYLFWGLDDISSSEESSSRTRGDPFMDDYVSADTARCSTPLDHPSGAANSNSMATSTGGSSDSRSRGVATADPHRHRHHPHHRKRRPPCQGPSTGTAASTSSSSCSSSPRSSPTGAAAGAAPSKGGRRRSEPNFDYDDISRDDSGEEAEVSVDRTNYWLQAGYAGGNGASSYERGASGGGIRDISSSGSATVEDTSWDAGMMGGVSSRSGGSSRGGSGARVAGGEGSSGLPRRRYLVEQNLFREHGW